MTSPTLTTREELEKEYGSYAVSAETVTTTVARAYETAIELGQGQGRGHDRAAFLADLDRVTASDSATREVEDNPQEVAELRAARDRMARGEVRWVGEGESVLDAHT